MAASNKAQAVYEFWSGFTWPAYDENTVPDDAQLPYITFEAGTSGFNDAPLGLTASLWARSMSWSSVEEKAAEIAAHLGEGGSIVRYPSGALWVKRGSPWSQRLSEPDDDSLRRIVLNIEAEYLS
jgi:hypothetical protein